GLQRSTRNTAFQCKFILSSTRVINTTKYNTPKGTPHAQPDFRSGVAYTERSLNNLLHVSFQWRGVSVSSNCKRLRSRLWTETAFPSDIRSFQYRIRLSSTTVLNYQSPHEPEHLYRKTHSQSSADNTVIRNAPGSLHLDTGD